VGLVLGAGGTVGHAFHAGVLAALEADCGWDARSADVVLGTSAGSVVASMLRAGFSAGDLAARARGEPMSAAGERLVAQARTGSPPRLPRLPPRARPRGTRAGMASPARVRRALREPWRASPASMAAAMMPAGEVSTELITLPLQSFFGTSWPPAPTWVVAVELDTGRRVVFGRAGSPSVAIADAVAASCAIPGYFEPVTIEGVRYVDGGVASPTNADVLRDVDLDLVVVSSPMSTAGGTRQVRPDSPLRHLARLALGREVARLRRRGVRVVTFQPSAPDQAVMAGNPLDAAKRRPVCEQAMATTSRRLRRQDLRDQLAPLFASP
jgi:NTE family protein